jgi:hypothetical protein
MNDQEIKQAIDTIKEKRMFHEVGYYEAVEKIRFFAERYLEKCSVENLTIFMQEFRQEYELGIKLASLDYDKELARVIHQLIEGEYNA